jgi:ribosomal protein L35AE/L33A
MNVKTRIISLLLLTITMVITASAQTGRVSLKPVFKPGQEYRYLINASVDTQVTPTSSNGIASNVHRETVATVVIRAAVSEKGALTNEATIESITTRTTVDGVDRPAAGGSLVGRKIEYQLDSDGRVMKVSLPETIGETGLAQVIFSLGRWAPTGQVAVGQTWGPGAGGENAGDFEYISGTLGAEISKGATTSYKLSSLNGSKAMIEGALTLSKNGTSLLTTRDARIDVGVIAAGNGKTLIEYDVAASLIIAAKTETSFEGRLSNTLPTREGEKLQPREGTLVETAKSSVKLIQ